MTTEEAKRTYNNMNLEEAINILKERIRIYKCNEEIGIIDKMNDYAVREDLAIQKCIEELEG